MQNLSGRPTQPSSNVHGKHAVHANFDIGCHGLGVTESVISHAEFITMMNTASIHTPTALASLHRAGQLNASQADIAVVGVVAERTGMQTSAGGRRYTRLVITDGVTSLRVMVWSSAGVSFTSSLRSVMQLDMAIIFSAHIMSIDSSQSSDKPVGTLSCDDESAVMRVGKATGMAQCAAIRKDGLRCTMLVATERTEYCTFHAGAAWQVAKQAAAPARARPKTASSTRAKPGAAAAAAAMPGVYGTPTSKSVGVFRTGAAAAAAASPAQLGPAAGMAAKPALVARLVEREEPLQRSRSGSAVKPAAIQFVPAGGAPRLPLQKLQVKLGESAIQAQAQAQRAAGQRWQQLLQSGKAADVLRRSAQTSSSTSRLSSRGGSSTSSAAAVGMKRARPGASPASASLPSHSSKPKLPPASTSFLRPSSVHNVSRSAEALLAAAAQGCVGDAAMKQADIDAIKAKFDKAARLEDAWEAVRHKTSKVVYLKQCMTCPGQPARRSPDPACIENGHVLNQVTRRLFFFKCRKCSWRSTSYLHKQIAPCHKCGGVLHEPCSMYNPGKGFSDATHSSAAAGQAMISLDD